MDVMADYYAKKAQVAAAAEWKNVTFGCSAQKRKTEEVQVSKLKQNKKI